MAFPQVASITESEFSTAATAHLVAMPATVNAGDLLIVLWNVGNSTTATTTPSGWTAHATNKFNLVYLKDADGTEGGTTVDFVTATSREAAAQVYRILAGTWYGTLSTGVESASATATSATPDPPALNPTNWDAEDTLWIAVTGDGTSQLITAIPTSYNNQVETHVANAGDTKINSCRRELNTASENPGTFTLAASREWCARTIAVRPGSALLPPLFSNSNTFYTPTLVAGSVTLSPSLFSNSNTFYTPTLVPGVVTLLPSLFSNGNTFYQPTLLAGSITLTAPLLTNTNTFYDVTLTSFVTLQPTLLNSTNVFYGVTLLPGSVTLTAPLFTNVNTFYSPLVGAFTVLEPPFISSGSTIYPPTLVYNQTILPPLISSTSVIYAPRLRQTFALVQPNTATDFVIVTPNSATDFTYVTPNDDDDFTEVE